MEYGIVVFDIDTQSKEDGKPQDSINVLALYGPYSSQSKAEEFRAFAEDETRKKFTERFGDGRYEFHLKIMLLENAPVLGEGWL